LPLYEFICDGCGPFERWRDHRQAAQAMACPACGQPARRIFSTPAARAPRAMRLMTGVGPEGRDRIVRAHTGEPRIVSEAPVGTRVSGGLAGPLHIHGRPHPPSRPWQVGHC
jgi:putative FmdB family regulatory protein